jgi:hypothetical protein
MAVIDNTSIIESGETAAMISGAKSDIARALLGLEGFADEHIS